jgi:hypothetical protein
MKLKLFLFVAVIVSALLFSCSDDNNKGYWGVMKSPNYVQTYLVANDFDLKEVEGADKYVLSILFKGEEISNLYPANKLEFEALAKSFNDVSYSGYVMPNANKALTEPLSIVSVTCDKDFDAEHNAGQSLDDIVLFCATSPYNFIQGGYKDFVKDEEYPDYWYGMIMNRDVGYKPIDMQINAINRDNSLMLYPICYLYFKKSPTTNGEYRFTVTIKVGDTDITKNIQHSF